MTPADTLRTWLKNNPLAFQARGDGDIFTLVEFGSGKTLDIDAKKIIQHKLTPHPQGQKDYLNLIFENGRELVLCHVGFAFAPDFTSTGPLADAPPVSCFQDYYSLLANLDAIKRDPTQKSATLLLFQVLISILDGAKAIGLDTGQEEEDLDKRLTEFEKGF